MARASRKVNTARRRGIAFTREQLEYVDWQVTQKMPLEIPQFCKIRIFPSFLKNNLDS